MVASTAEVRLLLNAVDQSASRVMGGVTKQMSAMEKATQKAGDFLGGMGVQFGAMANPAMLAGQAVMAFADYAKVAVSETVDYSKQVRDLAANLNISTEETSRMIQAADDYGISTASLTTAMEMALKNGFAPTIESLADAADQYLALEDPTERAAALTKIYGRNWAELTPMLKEGGKAIRDAAAAQADNLIVTEESAQAARDYEIAMDGLTDTFQGLKYEVGNKVIPALTELVTLMNESTEKTNLYEEALQRGLIKEGEFANSMRGTTATTEELQARLEEYETQVNSTMSVEELRAGVIGNTTTETAGLEDATTQLKDAMANYSKELIFNKASQDMDADAAIALGVAMGVIDERTLIATERLEALRATFDANRDGMISAEEAASGYSAAVMGLYGALEQLDGKTARASVVYTITNVGSPPAGLPGTAANIEMYATGGTIRPGGRGIVGDDGPELLEMTPEGAVITPITNNNTFSMNVYSNAPVSTVTRDFGLMQSMVSAR